MLQIVGLLGEGTRSRQRKQECTNTIYSKYWFSKTFYLSYVLLKIILKEIHMQVYIKDIMQSEVTMVSCESTVEQSETLMLNTSRRCVPVVDKYFHCVGMLSNSDILRVRNAKKDVSSTYVRDVMNRDIVSVSPHCSVDDAMELMIDCGVHHVFVISNKQVCGIVSVIDIIQVDRARTFNAFADSESYVPAG